MAAQAKPDYYSVLGVERQATAPEIQSAFNKLASAFHASGKPRSIDDVEELRKYARAYRVLSNVQKRDYYDRRGFDLPETAAAGGFEPVSDQAENLAEAYGDVASILGLAGIVVDVLGG